ncbi:MAG: FAD:protein FMN transferase [Alteraurantiacibacter sp.]
MTDTQSGRKGEFDQILLPPGPHVQTAPPPAGSRESKLAGETMGTVWVLTALLPPTVADDAVRATLEGVFARIVAQMSQWEEGSELSVFNRAPAATRHAIGSDFARVLDCAIGVAQASGGAFDPTIGATAQLWGFGSSPAPSRMPDAENASRTRLYDWRDLRREDGGRTLVQPGGLTLDFSGIAKGHAVDAGMMALHDIGLNHALLEIGGELRGSGLRADGMPWWTDLETPPGSATLHARVGLTGWSIGTSGSYLRRRQAGGKSWSHTIDPVSGMPVVDDILSVSVLHPGCMQADALATAIIALGPKTGKEFADDNAIPARIVLRNETLQSSAWRGWVD